MNQSVQLPVTVASELPAPPKPQTQPPNSASASHRAIHKIRLNALSHNYEQVESAANQQKCSVIVVVKADGYGHGALASALHLADDVGADAFAVATLEEGIALRKAFQQNPPGNTSAILGGGAKGKPLRGKSPPPTGRVGITGTAADASPGASPHVSTLFQAPVAANSAQPSISSANIATTSSLPPSSASSTTSLSTLTAPVPNLPPPPQRRRQKRSAQIRILVLGPPVGFPRCFDDYYYHSIECMVSGPEVASALKEWASNHTERKLNEIERTANETKEALANRVIPRPPPPPKSSGSSQFAAANGGKPPTVVAVGNSKLEIEKEVAPARPQVPSATLGNVSGQDLAKEVRAILLNQRAAAENQEAESQQQLAQPPPSVVDASSVNIATSAAQSTIATLSSCDSSLVTAPTVSSSTLATTTASQSGAAAAAPASLPAPTQAFSGIEEAAKHSRTRQKVLHAAGHTHSFSSDEDNSSKHSGSIVEPDDGGGDITPVNVSPSESRETLQPEPQTTPKLTNRTTSSVPSASDTTSVPDNINSAAPSMAAPAQPPKVPALSRKRLRWHCLVDSGMGRLGFRTDDNSALLKATAVKGLSQPAENESSESQGSERPRDIVVEILKDLADMENMSDCPIEFFGMCTHMADASNPNTTNYTHSQMDKFQDLLKRVRTAGIPVPTVSTDNSAALLTTSLTHFDANALLKQTHFQFPSGPTTDTRGFVRTGGAIYGQRPTFRQLHPVSTLVASVRHVAILQEGDSVGYDRAYIARHPVRIATLTIGFADGYPRELGNGRGQVSIRGHLFKTAGNVCMDMLMVDLGPVTATGDADDDDAGDLIAASPELLDAGAQVVVGDDAILWGPSDEDVKSENTCITDDDSSNNGEGLVRLQDIAAKLSTTQSALTCGLDKSRVKREYK